MIDDDALSRSSELLRDPVRRLCPVTISSIVRHVIPVIDQQKFDRTANGLCKALSVLPGHDAIELAGHDEQRARNVRRDAFEREGSAIIVRSFCARALRAYTECFARERIHLRPK